LFCDDVSEVLGKMAQDEIKESTRLTERSILT
jgi:hypothetical protein